MGRLEGLASPRTHRFPVMTAINSRLVHKKLRGFQGAAQVPGGRDHNTANADGARTHGVGASCGSRSSAASPSCRRSLALSCRAKMSKFRLSRVVLSSLTRDRSQRRLRCMHTTPNPLGSQRSAGCGIPRPWSTPGAKPVGSGFLNSLLSHHALHSKVRTVIVVFSISITSLA